MNTNHQNREKNAIFAENIKSSSSSSTSTSSSTSSEPLNIIIAGGTGLIGQRLCQILSNEGCLLRILTRNPERHQKQFNNLPNVYLHEWGGVDRSALLDHQPWQQHISAQTIIINLAGENVGSQRWSPAVRSKIIDSRLATIQTIKTAMTQALRDGRSPKAFLQASAAGVYGNRGDLELHELTPTAQTNKAAKEALSTEFRIATCLEIEAAAHDAVQNSSTQLALLRIGYVLAKEGGILPHFKAPTYAKIKQFGNGNQFMPWVHVDDAAAAIAHIIKMNHAGAINIAAPYSATNQEFMGALAHANHQGPGFLTLPQFLLEWVLGDSACVLFDSQRLVPSKLLADGFEFKYQRLDEALKSLKWI